MSEEVPTGNTMNRTGLPPNCKEGGVWGTVKYLGETTKGNVACLGCLCCCDPLACSLLLFPQDETDAYCVDDKVYDAAGDFLFDRKGNNFIEKS